MLTAQAILSRANDIAKTPNYTARAQDMLNAVLTDLCLTRDFALSRDLFNFNFNPGLASNFGSGPYSLPLDYLRASGSSGEAQKAFFWTLDGVPHPMVPCDLSEFDMQVLQAGQQSYPWLWASDISNSSRATSSRYKTAYTAALTANSAAATVSVGLNIAAGDAISGEGITPGTTILAYNSATGAMTLSAVAAATLTAASVFSGVAAQAFAYPPPSGNYAVSIRYQKIMPPVTDLTKFVWFPDDGYLIDEVAGRMMQISDDSRTTEFLGDGMRIGRAGRRLQQYMTNMDDQRNRPRTVELDRRRFGPQFATLRKTKKVGW